MVVQRHWELNQMGFIRTKYEPLVYLVFGSRDPRRFPPFSQQKDIDQEGRIALQGATSAGRIASAWAVMPVEVGGLHSPTSALLTHTRFTRVAAELTAQSAMADSAYSFSLTTFNPSGKLLQIEYALNAVNSGGKTSLGIRCTSSFPQKARHSVVNP
jgi:hypothetical protein